MATITAESSRSRMRRHSDVCSAVVIDNIVDRVNRACRPIAANAKLTDFGQNQCVLRESLRRDDLVCQSSIIALQNSKIDQNSVNGRFDRVKLTLQLRSR